MTITRQHISAFTLIELMIAIALGMVIVYTALAGFRVASQTITTSNRLSLENSLMRSGYFEAQTQLDFWTNHDDPTVPDAERPLKSITGGNTSIGSILSRDYGMKRGLPFSPMRSLQSEGVWPKTATIPRFSAPTTKNGARVNEIMPRDMSAFPLVSSANADDPLEADKGFDPSYAWAPHDPRTWIRVNLTEKERDWKLQKRGIRLPNPKTGALDVYNPMDPDVWWHPDHPRQFPVIAMGRYILFSNPENTGGELARFWVVPDPNKSGPLVNGGTPDVNNTEVEVRYRNYPKEGTHTWYPNQMASIINAMGYAALCEYLPANSLYIWHTMSNARGGQTDGGWLNRFGTHQDWEFCNDNGSQRSARGIWRNTYPYSYGYINPRAPNDWRVYPSPNPPRPPATGNTLRQRFYQRYKADMDATSGQNANDLAWFISRTGYPESLVPQRPDVWPSVNVSVGRFVKSAHHVAVAKITRISPLTGEVIELSWTGLGTTLRGARLQRQPTTGWALWDNDPGVTNDPTLDSP